ncbi:MAG: hypothetical protein LH603_20320 [Pseudonocardia sp.]|nr:hypothetical protein [Pseudonocardia sp.]
MRLFLSGTVLLLAGWGAVAQIADAQPEHPTVLANDYGVSLALLLGVSSPTGVGPRRPHPE